jgi:hypothetical protein
MLGRPCPVLGQRVDDADQGGVRQSAKNTGVVGPHDARAYHADSHPIPLIDRHMPSHRHKPLQMLTNL